MPNIRSTLRIVRPEPVSCGGCGAPSFRHGCVFDEEITPDDVFGCTCCKNCEQDCADRI